MALLSHSRAWNCSAETARAARQSSGERGHSNTNRTRTHAFYPSLYALHRPCPELVGALRAERERPFTLNGLLFDDLVSAGEDRRRDGEAERLGGLEIDDQLEGRWLLDRQIGRLGALQDPSGVNADLVTDGYVVNSIADQAADRNEWRMRIYCRNGMALRQRDDLLASARDEPIGVDDEPDGMQPVEGREGGVDFGFGAGFQDRKLHLLHEGCFLRVSDDPLGIRIVRVHQQSDHAGLRNQLGKQLDQLRHQLGSHIGEASEVASRASETGDEADPDRVADAIEDDRDRRGRAFRR